MQTTQESVLPVNILSQLQYKWKIATAGEASSSGWPTRSDTCRDVPVALFQPVCMILADSGIFLRCSTMLADVTTTTKTN